MANNTADTQLWTVERITAGIDRITGRQYLAATVHPTNDTGEGVSTMTLSQYPSEAPTWRIDSLTMANGYPVFQHGAGDRSCAKRVLDGDHPMSQLLNTAVEDLLAKLEAKTNRVAFHH